MIQVGKVAQGMMEEEGELNRLGLDLMGDVSKDTIMIFAALQAIHKRQRDHIALLLQVSNG